MKARDVFNNATGSFQKNVSKLFSNPLSSCMNVEEEHKELKVMQPLHDNTTEDATAPPSREATVAETSEGSHEQGGSSLGEMNVLRENTSERVPPVVETTGHSVVSDNISGVDAEDDDDDLGDEQEDKRSFLVFRMSYLFVTLVIMLADGLQGTHLYVLYEGYGFSVASLYCLGFITGAVTAPISGPMIDRFGRKKSALLYCALEVWINMLEQFPFLSGLIVSRVVGGVTTNLLSTVFEAWVDTEYRSRGFSAEKYETLMRDSVIVSNLAAIASGYLAHVLAEALGPVGPFEGAVTCTAIAFAVVFALWTENYGNLGKEGATKSNFSELKDTMNLIRSDSRVLRVCITQGLTMGSLHIFIFLWSPVMKDFSVAASNDEIGLDSHGEPAYGLIFGAFMAAGVLGGLCSQKCRKLITILLSPLARTTVPDVVTVEGEGEVRPMAVEFQGALCYFLCALLLVVPAVIPVTESGSFTSALTAFVAYEFLVGIYSPCEGVIRSLYIPPDSRGSVMTVPRIIVNVAVALGVVSTEVVSRQTALAVISLFMIVSGVLQLSLVSKREWSSLFGRIEHVKRRSVEFSRSISMGMVEAVQSPKKEFRRCASVGAQKLAALQRSDSDFSASLVEIPEPASIKTKTE